MRILTMRILAKSLTGILAMILTRILARILTRILTSFDRVSQAKMFLYTFGIIT
jgi:hypothetical protein